MRRTLFTFLSVIALLATGVVAGLAAGGNGPVEPPPKIAFLANGINPADALAAGGIAGQLGAPLFTTRPDVLEEAAKTGIVAYDPELVIVLGGPIALAESVLTELAAATGLAVVPAIPVPAEGIVRIAGEDRFSTAAAVAGLLAAYNPAYLPVDATALGAIAADTASEADNADTLDDLDSTAFALADQSCSAGQVVTGIAADGAPTCAVDNADGGDADALDGLDASSLIRVAGHFDSTDFVGTSPYTNNAVTITAPVDGYLHITSSTMVFNGATVDTANFTANRLSVSCKIEVDGQIVTEDITFDERVLAGSWTRCSQTEVFAVGAGDHDVNVLIGTLGATGQVQDSRLSVLFTPFGEVFPQSRSAIVEGGADALEPTVFRAD